MASSMMDSILSLYPRCQKSHECGGDTPSIILNNVPHQLGDLRFGLFLYPIPYRYDLIILVEFYVFDLLLEFGDILK